MTHTQIRLLMMLECLNIGGTETHTLSLTKQLLHCGIDVTIYSFTGGNMHEDFTLLGCPVYIGSKNAPNRLEEVRKLILNHHINIIHTHDKSAELADHAARELNLPLVYTVHGTYYDIFPKLNHEHKAFVSVSAPIKKWLDAKGIPSTLIHNGIDMMKYHSTHDRQSLKHQLGIPVDTPLIVYAARLGNRQKFKLCDAFIKTCSAVREKLLSNMHVAIVGSSPNNKRRLKLIMESANKVNNQNGETFIHVLGERKEMERIYRGADCVVGTGRIALEAMACETKVIAVGSAGYVGFITPNNFHEACMLHFGDHAGKAAFSEEVFCNDLAEIFLSESSSDSSNIKKNRELVEKRFGIERVTNDLIQVYKRNMNLDTRSKHPNENG
ncbi:glycosyltransferase involved in cell wall biosynthesis [Neobacillus niacini]|uniref:glycosyltransferase n=1 Tax=Neobacillus niacini TaxID=86668 RepID=UPI0027837F54|nr:glycosyltransferase [Neobacillus niacini]MDQ1002252.1 glycosyltransferase involved in cell wall biosynthesis [Neobacillus niacini]